MQHFDVVVTRHEGLVTFLRAKGVIDSTVEVIEHATLADVAGKHVLGVLPLSLAAYAASVTEVPLSVPAHLRGQELSANQVASLVRGYELVTYTVTRTDTETLFRVGDEITDMDGNWGHVYSTGAPYEIASAPGLGADQTPPYPWAIIYWGCGDVSVSPLDEIARAA